MHSAVIPSERRSPAVLCAEQLAHQMFVHPGPLVLGTAFLKFPARAADRDRTVSRRSKPSSRAVLMGAHRNPCDLLQTERASLLTERTPQPLEPTPALGCDEPTSRCQTIPSIWTLGEDQPVIPGVPFSRLATALPLATAGSLVPAFAPVRHVCLTVKHPCALALDTCLPTRLRVPLGASVTL